MSGRGFAKSSFWNAGKKRKRHGHGKGRRVADPITLEVKRKTWTKRKLQHAASWGILPAKTEDSAD
jgi:hypothetical protein